MHLNKLFSSAIAVTSLLVSFTCHAEVDVHLARRWIDVQRRDLEAEIRSLDEDWAFERRDLELKLRSLDPVHVELNRRGSQSPSLELRDPAGTKGRSEGHKSHLISRTCSKSGGSRKGKRASPPIEVDAGFVASAGANDVIKTWNLKVCIGMAAVNDRRQKVLAHINGEATTGVSYVQQIEDFKSMVHSRAPGARILLSFPDMKEPPAHLRERLLEMIMAVEEAAVKLDQNYRAVERRVGEAGFITIEADGTMSYC